MALLGLFVILALILTLPFFAKKVEEELEIFLFVMGCIAISITSQWNTHLILEALTEPIKITIAVLIAGFAFRVLQKNIANNVERIVNRLGIKVFAFLVIVLLGALSSIITAIIAALVLVEIVTSLTLDRRTEILFVVLACFSIGFGAALTPIGEPLATITIAKLKGVPYHADFFFLFRYLWCYIVAGIVILGGLGALWLSKTRKNMPGMKEDKKEDIKSIIIRTVKVYFFIVALVLLGKGFKPIIDTFIVKIPYQGIYWLNMLSAVLDNATLAAAQISPNMGLLQIKSALIALMISGGMLIPGNIPNIISAGKLKIKSSEWAKIGIPLGLGLMLVYFLLLVFIRLP